MAGCPSNEEEPNTEFPSRRFCFVPKAVVRNQGIKGSVSSSQVLDHAPLPFLVATRYDQDARTSRSTRESGYLWGSHRAAFLRSSFDGCSFFSYSMGIQQHTTRE